MNDRTFWRFTPQTGPVLILLLIGLVLLSALLYYRAVKIQRFLEPALALSQPRNEFTKRIHQLVRREFGERPVRGLEVRTSSIFLHRSLLFSANGKPTAQGERVLKKLARLFLGLMKEEQARAEIALVLINARFTSYGAQGADAAERLRAQLMVGLIQDALFGMEPELGVRYSTLFAAVVQPVDPHAGSREVLEFRIVPSEFLHIEVLERLNKYAQ